MNTPDLDVIEAPARRCHGMRRSQPITGDNHPGSKLGIEYVNIL